MALSEEAKKAKRDFAIAILGGGTLDDHAEKRDRAIALGAFPSLKQRDENVQIVMKAGDKCLVPPHTDLTNRGFFRNLARQRWQTLPDPAEPGITSEEAKKRQRDRDKLYPAWDGIGRDPKGNPIKVNPEGRFNTSDLRAIRALLQAIYRHDEVGLFDQIIEPWSVGDFKDFNNFHKANEAQGQHRSAVKLGKEFKDDKARDMGVFGPWKGEYELLSQIPTALSKVIEKVGGLSNKKKARDPKFQEEAVKVQGEVPHFSVEEAVLSAPAFRLALSVGDIREFARLSPLWDDDDNWIKLPEESQLPEKVTDGFRARPLRRIFPEHVQRRLDSHRETILRSLDLSGDEAAAFESMFDVTLEDMTILVEGMYRHPDLVTRLHRDWGIGWTAIWDHIGFGGNLTDFLKGTASPKLVGAKATDVGLGIIEKLADLTVDLPGKIADARLLTTIVTFIVSGLFYGWLQILVWGDFDIFLTLVLAGITTWVFRNQMVAARSSRRKTYLIALTLVWLLAIVVVPRLADSQRQGIQDNNRQEFLDRTQHLRR